jgi:hypothetical protein
MKGVKKTPNPSKFDFITRLQHQLGDVIPKLKKLEEEIKWEQGRVNEGRKTTYDLEKLEEKLSELEKPNFQLFYDSFKPLEVPSEYLVPILNRWLCENGVEVLRPKLIEMFKNGEDWKLDMFNIRRFQTETRTYEHYNNSNRAVFKDVPDYVIPPYANEELFQAICVAGEGKKKKEFLSFCAKLDDKYPPFTNFVIQNNIQDVETLTFLCEDPGEPISKYILQNALLTDEIRLKCAYKMQDPLPILLQNDKNLRILEPVLQWYFRGLIHTLKRLSEEKKYDQVIKKYNTYIELLQKYTPTPLLSPILDAHIKMLLLIDPKSPDTWKNLILTHVNEKYKVTPQYRGLRCKSCHLRSS